MPVRPALTAALRTIALAASLIAPLAAQADEYSDVSQLVRSGKLTEALGKADHYLSTKPRDPQMRFLKGVIQTETGKTNEAVQTFTQLTQDYPELPEPYNNLAVLYAAQNQFDKARTALEMAIRTNPSYATAHENLGDIYARLAGQAYSKALQLDGANQGVQPKLSLIHDMLAPGQSTSGKAQKVAIVTPAAPASAPAAVQTGPAATHTPAPATTPAAVSKPAPAPAPAPSAAASTAASPPTPAAPPPAPSPTPSAPVQNHEQAIEKAVQAWAQAWEGKKMDGYLAAYSKDFELPGNLSRKDWEKQRRDRILGKSTISVKISQLRIKIQGDKAQAQFRQDYKADSLNVSSRKTLHLHKTGERWLITREGTGG